MGGVCSSANPLDRTPSELSFRAFQLVEDLKPFTYTKPPKRRNVTPIDEIVETETELRQTSLSENKHQNPETMAPKEVQKMKGITVNSTATKNSGSSKVLYFLFSFSLLTVFSRKGKQFRLWCHNLKVATILGQI